MVPDVFSVHYGPQRPRRHITFYMTGSWKNLIQAKHVLAQITNERIRRIPMLNCNNFEEFQDFTFNQQLRSNFKILKRIFLEESYFFLKFWDTTSYDLRALTENVEDQIATSVETQDLASNSAEEPTSTPFLKEAFPEL